jgi:uncharacterized protein
VADAMIEAVLWMRGKEDSMRTAREARELIQDILTKLLTSYAPQKVILFGSYAYGMPRQDSDIDLLIIKETSERFLDRWVTVRRILSDPARLVPLETLVLTPQEVERRLAIGDQFLAEILDKGEVLYAA